MKNVLAVVVVSCAGLPAVAQTVQSRWLNPTSGDWRVSSNWDTNNVPNTDLEEAIINVTPGGYTVSMSGVDSVARLSLNAGRNTTLNICQGCILGIRTADNGLFNAGVILVGQPNTAASASDSRLSILLDNTEINGSGVIRLQGYPEPTNAQIQKVTFGGGIIIGANQTIEGAGRIALDTIVNNGTIAANVAGHFLLMAQSGGGLPFVNTGSVIAENGGLLSFGYGLQNEAGSVVEVRDGSVFQFSSAKTHTGGTLASIGTGEFQYLAVTTLSNITLAGKHTVQPFGNIIIDTAGGPVSNEGTLNFENGQQASLTFQSIAGNSVALSGVGTLRFSTPIDFAVNAEVSQSDAASLEFVRFPSQNVEGNVNFRTSVRIGRMLAPGLAAALRVGTMYTQRTVRLNTGSVLEMDVLSPTQRDQLLAFGTTASLQIDPGVELRIKVPNSYSPADGEEVTIVDLTASPGPNVFGQFDSVVVESNNPSLSATAVYTPRVVRVRFAVNACDSIDFNADGLFPDDNDLVDLLSVLAGGPC